MDDGNGAEGVDSKILSREVRSSLLISVSLRESLSEADPRTIGILPETLMNGFSAACKPDRHFGMRCHIDLTCFL